MHSQLLRRAALTGILLAAVTAARAVPVEGTILRDDAGAYSFYVDAGGPQVPDSGNAPGATPLFFDIGEPFDFEFTEGLITSAGPQTYFLFDPSGVDVCSEVEPCRFDLLSLEIAFGADEFLGGEATVQFLGGAIKTVTFADDTPSNRVVVDGMSVSAFLFGFSLEGAQLNLGFTGRVPGAMVPEPGVLALLGLGALAFAGTRRSRRHG